MILPFTNIVSAENNQELHEVFSVSVNPQVSDKYIHFEQSDRFVIRNNILSLYIKRSYKNVNEFNFTYRFQSSDNTKSVSDLIIKKNNKDTNQSSILHLQKNGDLYVGEGKPFLVKSSDIVEISHVVGGAVKGVEIEFLNITLNEFFYPFDKYKMRVTQPPSFLNIRERKVEINGQYEIDENKTNYICPNRIGKYNIIPLINNRTGGETNLTLNWEFNLNNQKSTMKKIEDNDKTTLIFEPIRATQSAIVEEYINNTIDYQLNESNSCIFNLQYNTRFPTLLVTVLIFILLISSYISTNKYYHTKTTKKRIYLESTTTFFIIPILATYAIAMSWVNRPIIPTLLDISVLIFYIFFSIIWLYIFKKIKKRQFIKNTSKK